jgi:anti-sigma regulatory factor (Ser/Thr protein kinase)
VAEPEAASPPRESAGVVHEVWPADAHRLADIRDAVRRWLAPLALPEETDDDIVLAVNEAVSNSIDHAHAQPSADDTVELTLWTEARGLWIEIRDHGRWRTPNGRSTGRGRGIAMMRLLMASVAIHHDDRGTRVLLGLPLGQGRTGQELV